MIVNRDHPLIYENLSLIITEFEKAAIASGTRQAATIVAQNPLSAMDQLLNGAEASLGKVKDSRKSTTTEPVQNPLNAAVQAGTQSAQGASDPNDPFSLEYDADLQELFGGDNNPVANYIEECLNCNLRLQFDWQLKPLNLLGGIEALLDGIQQILDAFKLQLDPFKTLEGICDLLNMLKGLCIPDIIIVLLSLKMLIKKYVSDAINITLDWTTLLGPILKAIVQGIAALLEQITGVILAPLDCALNALYTANDLEREARELAGQVATFAASTTDQVKSIGEGNLPEGLDIEGLNEKYNWGGSTSGPTQYSTAPQTGALGAIQESFKPGAGSFSLNVDPGGDITLPSGFRVTKDTRLEDALRDINFADSTIIGKLIVPVQEARRYINDLLGNILKSLNSVQLLVSGGIGVQMGNIGIIMFLSDMVSLVMMIIQMLSKYPNVSDWCSKLEEHPEILEEAIRARGNPDIRVSSVGGNQLLLEKGPSKLMTISTCSSNRTGPEADLIQQWIRDLQR